MKTPKFSAEESMIQISNILWPPEDPEQQWSPDTIADVSEVVGNWTATHPVERLATVFSRLMGEALGAKWLKRVVRLNAKEANSNVCHSHDFIDANEVMAAAFKTVFLREPDPSDDTDANLWDRAWSLAKRKEFKP